MPTENIRSLICHPATASTVPFAIDVSVTALPNSCLGLLYRFTGDAIRIPAQHVPGPADGLWQHTCCEAFFMDEGNSYREFNFSPSGQWAAYRFGNYRERDTGFTPACQPQCLFTPRTDGFDLQAILAASLLPPGDRLHIGLTAVVEAADGGKTYWALAHGAAQPDFHLRQSFTLTLKRPTP